MITVISGTNRKGNETEKFAKHITALLQTKTTQEIKVLSLVDLPLELFHTGMYEKDGQSNQLAEIQDNYMIPADKMVFVFPEYNGSFPGVLKLFIDACSVRANKPTFSKKKAALVGIASGRAGNLRGMDHLSGVLNHLGTVVMPEILPISSIEELLDEKGRISHNDTLKAIEELVDDLLEF